MQLSETHPAAPASLADARDLLIQALRRGRQQEAARVYLDGLLQRAPVQLNQIELARIAGR